MVDKSLGKPPKPDKTKKKSDDPSYNIRFIKDEDIKEFSEDLDKTKNNIKDFAKITEDIRNSLPNKENFPPISLKSYLSMLWGNALELKTSEIQNKVGTSLREKSLTILDSFHAKKDKDNPPTPDEITDSNFIKDLSILSNKTIHNIAHLESVHESFIEEGERKLENLKKTYEDRSSLTSLSSEGIITKIVTFIGGGSLITVLPFFTGIITPESSDAKLTQLEKIMELTKKYDIDQPISNTTTVVTTLEDKTNENIVNQTVTTIETTVNVLQNKTYTIYDSVVNQTNNQINEILTSSSNDFNLALFILVGIGAVISVNYAYKLMTWIRFENLRKSKNKSIQEYLIDEFKPKIVKVLLQSSKDFETLTRKYYLMDDNTWKQFLSKEGFSFNEDILENDARIVSNELLHFIRTRSRANISGIFDNIPEDKYYTDDVRARLVQNIDGFIANAELIPIDRQIEQYIVNNIVSDFLFHYVREDESN